MPSEDAPEKDDDDEENPQKNEKSADYTTYVVTRWYRAPELLLMCGEYTAAIDIWAVGCIIGELINRKPVFSGKDYLSQLELIIKALGKPSSEDYAHVTHKEALRYVKNLKPKEGIPFKALFPSANPLELDLLSKVREVDADLSSTIFPLMLHRLNADAPIQSL